MLYKNMDRGNYREMARSREKDNRWHNSSLNFYKGFTYARGHHHRRFQYHPGHSRFHPYNGLRLIATTECETLKTINKCKDGVDTTKPVKFQPVEIIVQKPRGCVDFLNLLNSDIVKNAKQPYILKDNVEGHLICEKGDILNDRFKINYTLGQGSFGKVMSCLDTETSETVAIKIIRNSSKYSEAAKSEIKTLQYLAERSRNHVENCLFIKMLGNFEFQNHLCITFEQLGCSIFDFLKKTKHLPMPLDQIKHIGYQICNAVKFLHDNQLIHTDLKPENILFVDSTYHTLYDSRRNLTMYRIRNTKIKLIDFGSTVFAYEHHSKIVSTRHYRAPEVILEIGWFCSCDIWSIACILCEMYIGTTLFQTGKPLEHLAMMERVIGPFPSHIQQKTQKTNYFSNGCIAIDASSESACHVKEKYKPLKYYLHASTADHIQMYALVKRMFIYDHSERITLAEAVRHPFFDSLLPESRIHEISEPNLHFDHSHYGSIR